MDKRKSGGDSPNGLRFIFRAFRHRNYRLFFVGQGISFIGTWMHGVAMGWMVYRLTGSKHLLGIISFSSLFPSFLASPLAGVLSDHWERRKIMLMANYIATFAALMVSVLVFAGIAKIWHLITLSVLLGTANGFDAPTRHAFVIEMVKHKRDLSSAIALNSSLFNLARIIGPAVAGILINRVGEAVCFLINSLSFLAAVVALYMMELPVNNRHKKKSLLLHNFLEGFKYTYNSKIIFPLILFLAVLSLFSVPYFMLMPALIRDIYLLDSRYYGMLLGASGIGSLIGALFLASRKNIPLLVVIIAASGLIFGSGVIAFSFSTSYILSLIIVPICGFGLMVNMASTNTLIQTVCESDKLGRVMSFYTMAFMGMAPIGNLIAGFIAEKTGAPATLRIFGTTSLLASIIFSTRATRLRNLVHSFHYKSSVIPDTTVTINAGQK